MNQLPPWIWPRSVYLHVPFCAHHCGYCDFAIAVGKDDRIDVYLDALAAELGTLEAPQQVRTLFIGGGTPTHLSAPQLERMLTSIRRWFPQSTQQEFSIEANPDTLTADKIRVLADFGVNRVSLGAQSFHPQVLRMLDRQHEPQEVPRAIERIRQHIPLVSLDLIFGVPGQREEHWRADLKQVLALEPNHLSTYGLTYEKGTPLWKRRQRKELFPLTEDEELRLYSLGIDLLQEAGFEHYEISNFARPGQHSVHNQVYWANEAYFGFGMGAARYVQGRRELNTRSLDTYLHKTLSGASPTFQSETLLPEERARETIALQLRRSWGVEREAFRLQTGFAFDDLVGSTLESLVRQNLLADAGSSVSLTRQGKYVADAVIARLL